MDAQLQVESSLEDIYKEQGVLIKRKHVKGHQDKGVGPLTWEECLNVEADSQSSLAGHAPRAKDRPFPAATATLWHKNYQVTRNIRATLTTMEEWEKYKPYLKWRFNWWNAQVGAIDWTLPRHGRLSQSWKIFVMSLTHEWLPLNDRLFKRGKSPTPICSACGTEE